MRMILSPTKKMHREENFLPVLGLPVFLSRTEELLKWLRGQTPEALQTLWKCNDAIAEQNLERLQNMELTKHLTPAILAYEGLAFQYMAPSVFTQADFDYVQAHLRILSGFYGVLKPMDGVCPYRLEMQARAAVSGAKDLYHFWGSSLYEEVRDPEDGILLNLASKEYSKAVEPFLTPEDTLITCFFGEMVNGRLVQKGTFAKMARGEMVRYLAQQQAVSPETVKSFDRLSYRFRAELSDRHNFIFERIPE